MARQQRHEQMMRAIRARIDAANGGKPIPRAGRKRYRKRRNAVPADESEDILPVVPELKYNVSHNTRTSQTLGYWLRQPENTNDVALKVCLHIFKPRTCTKSVVQDFRRLLQGHLRSRILGNTYTGDEVEYTDGELNEVTFKNDRVYEHKTIRFNYTTYEGRRSSDTVNPRTHADIMVQAHDDSGRPYWYARVIGIYHANVSLRGQDCGAMDFLHVRWMGFDIEYPTAKRLPRVGFFDCSNTSEGAFGFLDPDVVIRGVHLIPAFAATPAISEDLLGSRGPSIGRRHNNTKNREDWTWDWTWFYVNM
jgi:hypothetical protein